MNNPNLEQCNPNMKTNEEKWVKNIEPKEES